jgi:hypothetical protein
MLLKVLNNIIGQVVGLVRQQSERTRQIVAVTSRSE